MAGSKVKAPRLELTILNAINMPKYCSVTMSEKIRIKKPAETEITLIIIAFPLISMASSMASSTLLVFLKVSLKFDMIWME